MKNIVIIGASTGIGNALAELMLSQGHRVIGTYHKTPIANPAIESISLNVLENEIDLSAFPDEIHGFAYCPGSIQLKPFERITPDQFIDDYKLQVVGGIQILQKLIGRMKKTGNASIVFFSTVAVQNGFPFHTQVSASKGAIEGLTKALAAEYAPAIRVNCIAPSLTDTPLAAPLLNTDAKKEANAQRHPLKKIGSASNIAALAAFLLNEDSNWITGQIVAIDGGMSTLKV